MKVFLFWLISLLTDITGGFVWMGLISCNGQFHDLLREMHVEGNYTIDFCATLAIIPAILTAFYAASNYTLTLSWAIARRMSPVDVFSGRVSHFFLTLIFSGAGWALILFVGIQYIFPNARFEWIVPILKGISGNLYNYLFT